MNAGTLPSVLQIGVAIWLCLRRFSHRERFVARSVAALAALVACSMLDAVQLIGAGGGFTANEAARLAFFGIVFTVCVALGTFVCRVSVWTSVFCAAVGYTIQNLASSLGMLVVGLCAPSLGLGMDPVSPGPLMNAIYLLVLAVCEALLFRKLESFEEGISNDTRMLVVYAMVLLLVIGFGVLVSWFESFPGLGAGPVLLLRACHVAVCCFVLFVAWELAVNRRLEADAAVAERLAHERERQMQLSQETIDAINLKCHDMRHQIRGLAEQGGIVDSSVVEDMEHQIRLYDSSMRTGNRALDTVLTEKSLLCERRGITLACIADGAALCFLPDADIYALFGNALDNAIEAVAELDDPTLRVISLDVRAHNGLVSIAVENYYSGAVEIGADGLPASERGEGHGYGMRSMQRCAERWGGTLAVRAESDVFHVNIAIPLP